MINKTIDMSPQARAMIDTLGDEMGARYFRKEAFEAIMRPSYDVREPRTLLPTADANGTLLAFQNQPVDTLYGKNHVYTFTPADYERVVLYIHGGAYVHGASYVHVMTCDLLASELHAKVYMPLYTLSPQGTAADNFPLMDAVWADVTAENKSVILMGDSAGGGFALAFAEELAETNRPMPDRMVLFSPWVDVEMGNPDIPNYEQQDTSLAVYGLVESGKMWAAGADTADRHISPIHYDHWEKLPKTLLFTGDAEIFYPDVTLLCDKLRAAGVDASLVTGKGLFHVFPVYASLPEAVESRSIIKAFVKE